MNYKEDLEMEISDLEINLRDAILRSKEFQEMFPNLTGEILEYSEEVNFALDKFIQKHDVLYDTMKEELRVDLALIILNRRLNIELYKRLNLFFAKNYYDTEDHITVCSDEDLINLLTILKRILFK